MSAMAAATMLMNSASTSGLQSCVSQSRLSMASLQSQVSAVRIPIKSTFADFSGLKARAFCESESSFFGWDANGVIHASFRNMRLGEKKEASERPGQARASAFKVALLGAAGGIGPAELADSLKGVDLVVIPAGVPRKPGMTRDDLFNINAGIVKSLIEAVADNCPNAFIHIISNPVNSNVPIAAEVLKQKGVYNPKKLFGVTTLDVIRANTFVAQRKNLRLIDVDVPVVGGHAGITILPLLSKTKPSVAFTQEEIEELTVRIQNAGTEVVEAKAGAGSATLSMAYAAARFVESSLRALDGDPDVFECSYVQSELTELPFFASRVKLGKHGIEAMIAADLEGLTEYEQKALEALKPELKASIEKGTAFVQKQATTTAV